MGKVNSEIHRMKSVPPAARHTLFSGAILGATVLGLGLFTDSTVVHAEDSILKSGKAQVANKNTMFSAKYSFIAKFTKKTVAKPIGPGSKILTHEGQRAFTWTNPSDTLKGEVGVLYQNVGYHEGRQIDLKITVNNWVDYLITPHNLIFSYGVDTIAHRASGYSSVNQTWELVDHKTGKAAPLKGSFYTITDIDTNQGIRIFRGTMDKVDSIWVTANSKVQYRTNPDWFEIGYYGPEEFHPSDLFARATIFVNDSKFSFSWIRDYANAGILRDSPYKDMPITGANYYSYVAQKPARTEVTTPAKFVEDTDEEVSKKNTLKLWGEKFKYTIEQLVPDETSEYYYDSFVIKDTVIPSIDIDTAKVRVFNDDDDDVTSWFTNDSVGQAIKLTAKDTTLGRASFYGQSYRVVFDATLSDKATNESLTEAGYKVTGGFSLPNTSSVVVDGITHKSNNVYTIVPPLVATKIEKFNINSANNPVKSEVNVDVNKEHEYELAVTVGNEKNINKLVISDDLENVLDIKSVKVMEGSKDITQQGTLTIDETKESFTWTATNPTDFLETNLKVRIKAVMKDEQNLIPYSKAVEGKDDKVSIPNSGNLALNTSDKYVSNTVYIGTPGTKNEGSKYNVQKVDNVLTKVMQLVQQDEIHTYQLVYTVGNTRALNTLTLLDDLENVYDLKSAVVKYKGTDVTNQGTLIYDEEAESFTWDAKKSMDWLGKVLTVDVQAKMLKNITFNGYMKDNKIIIPNKGQMETEFTVDKVKNLFTTNNVDVNVPVVKSSVEKYHLILHELQGKGNTTTEPNKTWFPTPNSVTKENQVINQGEDHNYQLKFNVSNTKLIKKIMLKDDLENVFDLNKIQVLWHGKDITNDGIMVLDKNEESFTWDAKDPTKFYGDELIVNVSATLKKDVDFSGYLMNSGQILIPNVGEMVLNDGKEFDEKLVSPKIEIETPLIPSIADKFNVVNAKRTKDEPVIKNAGKHQYALDFKVINAKKLDKLVLSDDLEDVLTPTKAVVTMNGTDITAEGKMLIDDKTSKVTWAANEPQKYISQTLTLTIDADLKDAANLSSYVQSDGVIKIPNRGEMLINEGKDRDEKIPTPIVNIVTPGIDTSASKFNVLQGSAKSTNILSKDIFGKIPTDTSDNSEITTNVIKPEDKTLTKDNIINTDKNKNTTEPTKSTGELKPLLSKNGVNNVIDIPNGGNHAYDLLFFVTNKEKINSLVISDDLEDILDLKEVKVFVGNTEVTSEGIFKLNKANEAFTWTAKTPENFLGKEIRVSILATLKSNKGLESYMKDSKVPLIPNTGKISINGKETATNIVGITTPLTQTTVEKFNKNAEELTKSTMKVKLGEKHNYEIVYNISNEKDVTSLELSDDLENVLNLDSVKIFVRDNNNEQDITDKGTLEINDEKEAFMWSPKEIGEYAGQTLTVKVGATVKKDGDFTKYKDNLIPNIATVKVNNNEAVNSNKVDITTEKVPEVVPAVVTPPTPQPNIEEKLAKLPEREIQEGKLAKLVSTGRDDSSTLMTWLGALSGISMVGLGVIYKFFRRNREDELEENDRFL